MSRLRIAVGGFSHETNTFIPEPTTYADFDVVTDEALVARFDGVGNYLGGMIAAAAELGAGLVPTLWALALPGGKVESAAFERIVAGIVNRLDSSVDAVALDLHGASVVPGHANAEADLLAAIREAVGPTVPIVATLDLHANLLPRIVQLADLLFPVQLYPHTDCFDRGRALLRQVPALVAGRRPVMWLERLPFLQPTTTTLSGVGHEIVEACAARVESTPGLLDLTYVHGFPWSDHDGAGSSVLAVADDQTTARQAAEEVAAEVWRRRSEFLPRTMAPGQAVESARRLRGPVVLNEVCDNVGAGAPGDGTQLLGALLQASPENSAFGYLCDPAYVEEAVAVGVGGTVDAPAGGRVDRFSRPVRLAGTVRCITDGRFRLRTDMYRGFQEDLGTSVRVDAGGVSVIVTSRRGLQTLDPEVFRIHGLDVTRLHVVGIKSMHHFRTAFAPLVRHTIAVDAPGWSTYDLESLPRTARQPRYPLDRSVAYPSHPRRRPD